MTGSAWLRRRLSTRVLALIAAVVTIAAVVAIALAVDAEELGRAMSAAVDDPLRVSLVVALFGLAFVLRAFAWRRVLPGVSFGQALAGIHVALGGNHVLPLRLGEPLRIVSVVRRTGTSVEAATASTQHTLGLRP